MKMNPNGRVVGHWLLPVILSLAMFGQASAAALYSNIFVFGDSLSETGNFVAAGTNLPFPPYATGRWSNGPVWVEHLAGSLGLGVSASVAGGNNYAWGGAKTGADSRLGSPSVGLSIQKSAYLADHGNVAAHSTVSWPSSASSIQGWYVPSDSPRPRVSWHATT